jgi:DNA processing protein
MSGGVVPRACEKCLRRAWLVASLAGHIGTAVDNTAGNRAREILALPDQELASAMAGPEGPAFIAQARSHESEEMHAAVVESDAWATCRHDDGYPDSLVDLGDAPATVFGRGDSALLARLPLGEAVTVVGSRRPSRYGLEMASTLGRELAAAGLVVVSGMALGIDSAAHEGALEAGGRTVAVLGNGVDIAYPARSRRLYKAIVDRGVVIGELPPGTRARRWTFPARNRIMAALGAMTVVVEARERSGSLITAEMAQDLSREVGAVPGRVGASAAAGTNSLLRDGAQLIRGGQDVLDALLGPGARGASPVSLGPALEPELCVVLDLIECGANSADALTRAARIQPGVLAGALLRLELSGYVRSDWSGRYERTPLRAPDPG